MQRAPFMDTLDIRHSNATDIAAAATAAYVANGRELWNTLDRVMRRAVLEGSSRASVGVSDHPDDTHIGPREFVAANITTICSSLTARGIEVDIFWDPSGEDEVETPTRLDAVPLVITLTLWRDFRGHFPAIAAGAAVDVDPCAICHDRIHFMGPSLWRCGGMTRGCGKVFHKACVQRQIGVKRCALCRADVLTWDTGTLEALPPVPPVALPLARSTDKAAATARVAGPKRTRRETQPI